ncbi:MAG: MerR family transcriptional regulator, partial [Mycobacterium sp.]
ASNEETTIMNKLARLSAGERLRLINDFTAEIFAGLDPRPAQAARWSAASDLPDDPSPEQVDAWIELAELAAGFEAEVTLKTQ